MGKCVEVDEREQSYFGCIKRISKLEMTFVGHKLIVDRGRRENRADIKISRIRCLYEKKYVVNGSEQGNGFTVKCLLWSG